MVHKVLLSIGFCVSLASRPNREMFRFDPSSTPGPSQECSEGIPRMAGPIPFPADTALDDDNIGYWVERRTECLWGNYYNNVEHVDYDTLNGNLLAPDYKTCFERADGTQKCAEEDKKNVAMIRDVLDVHGGFVEVVKVDGNTITISSSAVCDLRVQIGKFQVGHMWIHPMTETFEFNDDGTLRKTIAYNDEDLSFDLAEWAENTLKGYGDYFKVDHANRDNYYQIDLGDNGVRVFIAFIIFWVVCGPIGIMWIAMKSCNCRRKSKYEKVNVITEALA